MNKPGAIVYDRTPVLQSADKRLAIYPVKYTKERIYLYTISNGTEFTYVCLLSEEKYAQIRWNAARLLAEQKLKRKKVHA